MVDEFLAVAEPTIYHSLQILVFLSFRKLKEGKSPRKRQTSTAEDVLTGSLQA